MTQRNPPRRMAEERDPPAPPAPFEYPPDLPDAVRHEYSHAEGGLGLWMYRADRATPPPAIVFFFGGGWIAAGGGSAGGHLAAMLASLPDPLDRPDALVLFNPVLVLAGERGLDPEEFSPYHRLDRMLPATLIQHGRGDSIVPFAASEAYVQRASEVGAAPVLLVGYDEQEHGFFNVGRSGGWPLIATLRRADEFLASLGWIDGDPSLTGSHL